MPRLGGKAFIVAKNHILRVTAVEGPQVADFNAFNKGDPKEMFWSGRTRLLQRAHLSVGDRLWSTPPRMRPMFTIIADTVEHKPLRRNARSHDLMYCRFNERLYEVTKNERNAPNCNSNIANAIAEFGLTPDYVHDAFNIFMTTGLDENDRFFYLDPDARKGDYLELRRDGLPGRDFCLSGRVLRTGQAAYRHSDLSAVDRRYLVLPEHHSFFEQYDGGEDRAAPQRKHE